MGFKKFRKDKFFYGYKAEMVFSQTFPEAKKLVNQADFSLNGYYIEIGRSRILELKTVVYFRKVFYNILKELHKEFKEYKPGELLDYLRGQPLDVFKTSPDKFLFVYFTKGLKHYTVFDYNDVLMGELNKTSKNEPYIIVKGSKLKKTHTLNDVLSDKMNYKPVKEEMVLGDMGVDFEENQFRVKK